MCMVALGVKDDPSKAFLIVPTNTNVEEVMPMVRPHLVSNHQSWAPPYNVSEATGPLRVCLWNNTTKRYDNVAFIRSESDVTILNPMLPNISKLTTELCKDLWQDVWHDNIWWPKSGKGRIEDGHQGVMSVRRITPPDSGMWNKTYEGRFEVQGILKCSIHAKKYPAIDVKAIVLAGYNRIHDSPSYIALYTVMQCSKIGPKLLLYVLYRDRPPMDVSLLVEQVVKGAVQVFTDKADVQLREELRSKYMQRRWIPDFQQAIENIQNGSLQIGIRAGQEQTRAIHVEGRNYRIQDVEQF